jgi:hypothetical protein
VVGVSTKGELGAVPPRTARLGVSAAALVFETWGWLFREQPVEDYGIDAHVEPVDGPDQPARQLLALQVKSGLSFFREETEDGWWFRAGRRHWHYWLGHVLPVIVVLYNPQAGALFWQHVDASVVQLTSEGGRLLVPRSQVLDSSGAGRDSLRQIIRDFRQADPLADSLPPAAARRRLGAERGSGPAREHHDAGLAARPRPASAGPDRGLTARGPAQLAQRWRGPVRGGDRRLCQRPRLPRDRPAGVRAGRWV